ncbi:hypothetical protein [Aeromicrobium sp.]|uniref:hypothetical protein n=1 Tax=Aeromicrobium sp. TaxID=1871063 RepID=UPI003D6B4D69
MTWTETRRRQHALREVRAIAAVRQDGVLPWSDDYLDTFTGPDDLLRDLAYFWRIHVETQIDANISEAELEERWANLYRQYAGVPQILDAHRSVQREHELAA